MDPVMDLAPQQYSDDIEGLVKSLEATANGESGNSEQLFPLLYRELHGIARRHLYQSAGGMTLGATTLLHEAYIDLSTRSTTFPDRARFFAYAARAMRGLIIDYVRERRALKRGGEFHLSPLDTQVEETVAAVDELLPLGNALDELAKVDPGLAELVELKFFSGFSFCEIAEMRQVSERTVRRDWQKARLVLHGALSED